MRTARLVGFAVILGAATVICFAAKPEPASITSSGTVEQMLKDYDKAAEDRAAAIAKVRARQDANEVSADSAPKHQVVNGWATVDLLEQMASDSALDRTIPQMLGEIATNRPAGPDRRVPILLLLGIAAVAWGFLTQDQSPVRRLPDLTAPDPDPVRARYTPVPSTAPLPPQTTAVPRSRRRYMAMSAATLPPARGGTK